MTWNPPNLLTVLRIALTPSIAWAIAAQRYGAALVLVMIAGLTDGLDGYLARRFGWMSRIGGYLDPIADKSLLVTIFLSLGIAGALPVWLVVLVMVRDVMILTLSAIGYLRYKMRDFRPSYWGKLSTFIQILTVVVALTDRAFPGPGLDGLLRAGVFATAAATGWSGVHYLWVAHVRWRAV